MNFIIYIKSIKIRRAQGKPFFDRIDSACFRFTNLTITLLLALVALRLTGSL